MTPDQYRRVMATILAGAASQITATLRLVPADPSSAQWTAFVRAIFPVIVRARTDATRLADRFYREARQAQAAPGDPPAIFPQPYTDDALAKALERSTLARLRSGQTVNAAVLAQSTVAVAERHIQDAARSATIAASRVDSAALAYARVGTGASSCAFCAMLISRGPVYGSPDTALMGKNGEPFHDHDDCLTVPVFTADNWPGRDDYLAAREAWQRHTQGLSGLNALNAFRTAIKERSDSSGSQRAA